MKVSFMTEAELNRKYQTTSFLESGGDYGCDCAVVEGDLNDTGQKLAPFFTDEWLRALAAKHDEDLGTVLVTGDVTVAGDLSVSDRLMCLVVLGSVTAKSLRVFETEVWIGGSLTVKTLKDDDGLVTVAGDDD